LVTRLAPVAPDAPSHEPQIATSESLIGLTFGAGKGIYFSGSHDSGGTFSAPVKVAEAAVVPPTRHRGPGLLSPVERSSSARSPEKSWLEGHTPTVFHLMEISWFGAQ